MNQRAILHIIFAIIGIPVLLTVGIWSATDPVLAGAAAAIVIGVVILTQMGQKCWLLIPFCAAFTGSLNLLPGHFAPRDLAVGVVALILPLIWVIRRFPIRVQLGNLEVALLCILAFVGQAFFRNPVGLSIFGSGTIGGRPYFEIGISVVAFVILSVVVVDFRAVKQLVYCSFAGSILAALYEALLGLFPVLAIYGVSVYQASTTTGSIQYYLGGGSSGEGLRRMGFLSKFGKPIITFVFSFRQPFQLLNPRNVVFLLLAVFACLCMLLSGFRSGIAGLGLLGIAACLLHRKPMQLVIVGLIGAPVLAIFLLLQGSLFQLPNPVQRALSFLPADWDSETMESAEHSSEWRFEMWEEALTSERYIRNKWMGDGFGFTAREMDYQMELMLKGVGSLETQDYYLTIGTFHSGPVETIKRVGYLGLATLLGVFVVFMKECVSMVNRSRGTPYFSYAMFVVLPLVIHPVMFVFVFGAFQGTITVLCLGGGMLRLIRNSMDDWERRLSESA